jgi:NADH:ubiquinone oxidoreductase subunit K
MLELIYLFAVAVVLVGIAFAGLATDRHFIVIMLGIELMFVASAIALVSFFSYGAVPNQGAIVMLISIWAVAAAEIITLVTFYVYMKSRRIDFDVTRLSRMKW